jgi:tetratricopeptide (TPR) repeat protein
LGQHADHPRALALLGRLSTEAATEAAAIEIVMPTTPAIPAKVAAPRDPPTGEGPTKAGTAAPIPPGRDHDWYLERGNSALETGDVERARQLFDEALRARPGSAEALTGLGYLAMELGTPASAVTRFQMAARSGYAEANIGLGEALRRMGRHAEALAAYRSYLERSPTGPSAYVARRQVAELEERLGDDAANGPAPGGEPPAPEPPPESGDRGAGADEPPAPPSDLPALEPEP